MEKRILNQFRQEDRTLYMTVYFAINQSAASYNDYREPTLAECMAFFAQSDNLKVQLIIAAYETRYGCQKQR